MVKMYVPKVMAPLRIHLFICLFIFKRLMLEKSILCKMRQDTSGFVCGPSGNRSRSIVSTGRETGRRGYTRIIHNYNQVFCIKYAKIKSRNEKPRNWTRKQRELRFIIMDGMCERTHYGNKYT